MKTTDIQTEIYEIIAEVLEIEVSDITDETDFVEDFEADSMALLEILVALERKFRIKIPEDRLIHFSEPDAIVKTVEEGLKENGT